MSRTVHEIAEDLATAQLFVEAAEAEHAESCRRMSDAGFKLSDATTMRDRLRLELRAALREAGDVWPDHGTEAPTAVVIGEVPPEVRAIISEAISKGLQAEWHRDPTADENGNPRVYRDPVKP